MEPIASKVYEAFGKTEQQVNQDVEIVENWIKTQPHLPEIMDDVKIRNFLILNKFSIEKTKQKIDMYYTIRTLIPDLYENCNPKLANMKEVFENTYLSLYPKALEGIYQVYFVKAKRPNVLNPLEISKMWFNMFEVKLYEGCGVGDIFVYDLSTTTLSDMRNITPSLLTKFFAIYKKVYALRLKNVYLVNSPPYVSILLSLFKAVLKPKLFERIKVCTDTEILKTVFDQEFIPKDYGGDGPSLEELNEITQKELAKFQERFDRLDTLKVDEDLRPEKLNNDEILGFYGSFKKLDVD